MKDFKIIMGAEDEKIIEKLKQKIEKTPLEEWKIGEKDIFSYEIKVYSFKINLRKYALFDQEITLTIYQNNSSFPILQAKTTEETIKETYTKINEMKIKGYKEKSLEKLSELEKFL